MVAFIILYFLCWIKNWKKKKRKFNKKSYKTIFLIAFFSLFFFFFLQNKILTGQLNLNINEINSFQLMKNIHRNESYERNKKQIQFLLMIQSASPTLDKAL